MAKPQEKLAESLETLRTLQDQGRIAIHSADLSRTHRERLLRGGFLQMVMKGWYIAVRPDAVGETNSWYASFWDFCSEYLDHRFGEDWCLSPEQSISLHAGNRTVPTQLMVRSPRGSNSATSLLHGTSLFDLRLEPPSEGDAIEQDGLRLYALPAALIASSPRIFERAPTDVRVALTMVRDVSELLERLLDGGNSTIAGRLAGAFRNVGRNRIADDIVASMHSAGYSVREKDPFARRVELHLSHPSTSTAADRIRIMWQQMRESVPGDFPNPPDRVDGEDDYLERVQETYAADAYHSLSIEGYRVRSDLIERVRSGDWNPDTIQRDSEHRDALAARGYWQAFQMVQRSLRRALQGENPGRVAEEDHGTWYRELFAPSVAAGIVRAADLAGYRNGQVYIQGSMYVPLQSEAARDAMPVFFDLLKSETEPSVRVILGHFLFVYIHPYGDGNGRLGRFLMNLMLAAGGYPWTIIPVQERDAYMDTLEVASVRGDLLPFTRFLARLVERRSGDT